MAEVEEFAQGRDPGLHRPGARTGASRCAPATSPSTTSGSRRSSCSARRCRPRCGKEKGYYAVGGCGGNIAWHTEADTLDIADRDRLLRDIRLYAGSDVPRGEPPVHPLDFRATVAQIEEVLGRDRRAQPADSST